MIDTSTVIAGVRWHRLYLEPDHCGGGVVKLLEGKRRRLHRPVV